MSSSAPSRGPAGTPAPAPETAPPAEPPAVATPQRPPYVASEGRQRDARMSIPRLGIEDLEVQAYEGMTDDGPGTDIQNRGIAARPHGPSGGTGPGGIGNYQITGHRNTAGGVFFDLPTLAAGDRVLVEAAGTVYVYRVTTTRITSFLSERSLREQRAAVPGRPGVAATRPMLTLSTCRTQEDRAEGNFYSDELDNPENRIDKIGVLVRTQPA